MSEFSFVLKCMGITLLLTFVMQLEWQGQSIERRIGSAIERSPAVHWVESAAAGGALMLQRTIQYAQEKTNSMWTKNEEKTSAPTAHKASR